MLDIVRTHTAQRRLSCTYTRTWAISFHLHRPTKEKKRGGSFLWLSNLDTHTHTRNVTPTAQTLPLAESETFDHNRKKGKTKVMYAERGTENMGQSI